MSATIKIILDSGKNSQWMSKPLGQGLEGNTGVNVILKVLSHRLLINYKKEKEKSWQWGNLVATNLTRR